MGLDPALIGAARLSALAHLEDLTRRGLIVDEGGAIDGPGAIRPPRPPARAALTTAAHQEAGIGRLNK